MRDAGDRREEREGRSPRHLVAISDIHLSELEPTTGLWMRYRQKPYAPSVEIAAMLDELIERVRGDDLTVVLNGDVFDFDAPRVRDGASVAHDLPRDARESVDAVRAILRDHPELVRGLGRVLAEGHKLVFVSGNHDAQLTLPDVREAIRTALLASAREIARGGQSGVAAGDGGAELDTVSLRPAGDIEFRAWFYLSEEGVLFEHGHQYDTFCSFRYPMAPFGKEPGVIQPTLGSLVSRLYMGRLGYFNPHVDATFMLSFGGHLKHWIEYYFFTRRSQPWIWFSGALRTLYSLIVHRDPGSRERRARDLAEAAAETGVSLRAAARHARLFAPPGEDRLWTCVRELWLDRALFAAAALAFVAAWALSRQHAFGVLATLGPVALAAVEVSKPKSTLGDNWRRVQRRARQVQRAHRAKAVVFGHTHTPEGVWENGVFFGNTGSWSAAYHDVACTEPLFEERPLVWLTARGGELSGGLFTWKKGQFRPA